MPTIEERIKKRQEYLASAESRRAAGDEAGAAYFKKLVDQEMEEIRAEGEKAPFQGYQPDLMSRAADWWKKPRPEKLESPVPLPEEQPAPPASEPPAPSPAKPSASLEERYGIPEESSGRSPAMLRIQCKQDPSIPWCRNLEAYLDAIKEGSIGNVIRQSSIRE